MLQMNGRLTDFATATDVGADRTVTNFTLAVNFFAVAPNGGKIDHTRFFKCQHWGSGEPEWLGMLVKGKAVSVYGIPDCNAYTKKDGEAAADLTFRVYKLYLRADK